MFYSNKHQLIANSFADRSMLSRALDAVKAGRPILIHDSSDREDEVDIVVAAKYITPMHISHMRQFAGGLICIAVDDEISKNIKLEYLHETLKTCTSDHKKMVYGQTKYGDHPSFSMWINHTDVRTGITDYDRALTANEMARLGELNPNYQLEFFIKSFKTPGHVPLLKSAQGLLQSRQGHTEMSVHLMKLAGISPVAVICEMMDPVTYKALSIEKATKYAQTHDLVILDVNDFLVPQEIYS